VAAGPDAPGGDRPALAGAFRPRSQDDLSPAGAAAKVAANLAALRTLHQLRQEQRPATSDEQRVLARWAGWGALPTVFDPGRAEFRRRT
jgi:hypothetical protein